MLDKDWKDSRDEEIQNEQVFEQGMLKKPQPPILGSLPRMFPIENYRIYKNSGVE